MDSLAAPRPAVQALRRADSHENRENRGEIGSNRREMGPFLGEMSPNRGEMSPYHDEIGQNGGEMGPYCRDLGSYRPKMPSNCVNMD